MDGGGPEAIGGRRSAAGGVDGRRWKNVVNGENGNVRLLVKIKRIGPNST